MKISKVRSNGEDQVFGVGNERSLAGWQSSKGSIERCSRICYVNWNVD